MTQIIGPHDIPAGARIRYSIDHSKDNPTFKWVVQDRDGGYAISAKIEEPNAQSTAIYIGMADPDMTILCQVGGELVRHTVNVGQMRTSDYPEGTVEPEPNTTPPPPVTHIGMCLLQGEFHPEPDTFYRYQVSSSGDADHEHLQHAFVVVNRDGDILPYHMKYVNEGADEESALSDSPIADISFGQECVGQDVFVLCVVAASGDWEDVQDSPALALCGVTVGAEPEPEPEPVPEPPPEPEPTPEPAPEPDLEPVPVPEPPEGVKMCIRETSIEHNLETNRRYLNVRYEIGCD